MVKALDLLLILHADHEQNCSTSTVRLVGSSQANLFASVSAGINALFGPLHGGANQAVLHDARADPRRRGGNVDAFVDAGEEQGAGRPADGLRPPGLQELRPARGDRQGEPRDEVLEKLGVTDQLLDIAKALEEIALADDYFVERKLYPNVDFYTGVIYQAMGFPTKMFTVLFALGRLPGWIAALAGDDQTTRRTRSAARGRSTPGPTERAYVPMTER